MGLREELQKMSRANNSRMQGTSVQKQGGGSTSPTVSVETGPKSIRFERVSIVPENSARANTTGYQRFPGGINVI